MNKKIIDVVMDIETVLMNSGLEYTIAYYPEYGTYHLSLTEKEETK